jgi:hypothetical protein
MRIWFPPSKRGSLGKEFVKETLDPKYVKGFYHTWENSGG